MSRTTILRTLSLVIAAAVIWIWLAAVHDLLPPPSRLLFNACPDTHTPQPPTLAQSLFPISHADSPDTTPTSWIAENHKSLRALFRCIELANCRPNQEKVVILTSFHFLGAYRGWVSGEDIWARSTVQALRTSGYTFLYALNLERTVQLYHIFPALVKIVIVEASDSHKCFSDKENCVRSDQNLNGIPAWKVHSFHFWTGPDNPLGRAWTLSPEAYALEGHPSNNYLGYSVEPTCLQRPFIAHSQRSSPSPAPSSRDDAAAAAPPQAPQGYIMAKRLSYLASGWPMHFYAEAANRTGLRLVLGANDDTGEGEAAGGAGHLPEGVVNHGTMTQEAFLDAVSRSVVLIGVGKPATSPTPYEALCLGVPFINPIMNWNHDHPADRTQWSTQHGMLKFLDPPYVYNVFRDDLDGFVAAVEGATRDPIDRYVLDRMRMSSVTERVRELVETDWRARAAEMLARWREGGFKEGPVFTL